MQPITYLIFTLVSVLIQFCVMDFINNTVEERNVENVKLKQLTKRAKSIINEITERPHGLFYRTKSNSKTSLGTNVSIDVTTETSSMILDWVYDENMSTTEEAYFTEMFATSDFENVTDITLLTKKNSTTKPNFTPKTSGGERCGCNILHKTCDINCCCDSECSDAEIDLFSRNCEESSCLGLTKGFIHSCDSSECLNNVPTSFLENLFCISKTNLPDKRLTDIQFDEAAIYRYPRWPTGDRRQAIREFSVYKYSDPIWLINDESRFYADIPVAVGNNYCSGKRPLRFLKNENIKCIVRLQDLHMFQAVATAGGGVLSMQQTLRNTSENETRLFRTNWTLLSCDDNQCRSYNKTQDEPHCTDNYCDNIATIVQYNFYCYKSRIAKAIIKLNVQRLSMHLPFITQRVKVKFYLSNDSIGDIIKLSGNPGYKWGLPVIISSAEGNHTFNFFNNKRNNILTYPDNQNGKCISSNFTYKTVQFGHNKRSKCRLHIQKVDFTNATSACRFIQIQILHSLRLDSTLYVCPYGNPERVSDEKWLRLQIDETHTYGAFKNSELTCFNLITRIGYAIGYAEARAASGNEILHAKVEGTTQNVTFDVEDVAMSVTVDTNFLELSKTHSEFAATPHLSVGLPKSFFLPSRGNIRDAIHAIVILCPFIALRQ